MLAKEVIYFATTSQIKSPLTAFSRKPPLIKVQVSYLPWGSQTTMGSPLTALLLSDGSCQTFIYVTN